MNEILLRNMFLTGLWNGRLLGRESQVADDSAAQDCDAQARHTLLALKRLRSKGPVFSLDNDSK